MSSAAYKERSVAVTWKKDGGAILLSWRQYRMKAAAASKSAK
jgi:hypothetical protein